MAAGDGGGGGGGGGGGDGDGDDGGGEGRLNEAMLKMAKQEQGSSSHYTRPKLLEIHGELHTSTNSYYSTVYLLCACLASREPVLSDRAPNLHLLSASPPLHSFFHGCQHT
ncbi:hypothetical protein GE21DRAFT_1338825 [Neurospora crassa]|nr:hypothetical protein GE21DRAFT_1338825 [Neurospora crassa]